MEKKCGKWMREEIDFKKCEELANAILKATAPQRKEIKLYIKKYDPDAGKAITEDEKEMIIDNKFDDYFDSTGVRLLFTTQTFKENILNEDGVDNVLTLLAAVLDGANAAGDSFYEAFEQHCRKLAEAWFNIEYKETSVLI